jgi:hypothetical protein
MGMGVGDLGEFYRGMDGAFIGDVPVEAAYLQGARIWPTFVPFTIQNINYTDEPVPAWTEGCWVTLLGGGGNGSGGSTGSGSNKIATGGDGGGGGARINRFFVPADLLGETFTLTMGNTWYQSGFTWVARPCQFVSGGVILRANWGRPGFGGGAGGATLVQGVTGVSVDSGGNGGGGGSGVSSGVSGQSRSNGAGSGGGGGGGSRDNGSGGGGASGTATGGTPGGLNFRGAPGTAGVRNSRSGNGGGGGGATPGSGTSGGDPLTRVEWV